MDQRKKVKVPFKARRMKKSAKSASLKKRARTTAFNKRHFLILFADSMGNVSKACKALHIDRQTYYNWMKDDPVFAQAVEDNREALIDHVEDKLFEAIDHRDITAIIFFLKTKGKKRGYVERQEMAGPDGGPIPVAITVNKILTDENPNGNGD